MKISNFKFQILNKSKICIFFSMLLVLYPLFLNEAQAQDFSLSVSPPLLKVMMMPGKTITQVYKLTNQGIDSQVNTDIASFTPSDELGNIKINYQTSIINRRPLFLSWFSFQNADLNLPGGFLVQSGKTQELVLKIKVPENAEEKDYYASLIFQVQPKGETIGASASKTSGILASNILLTVSKDGKPPKNGEIAEFSINALRKFKVGGFRLEIFDSFDTIPFTLRVANTGRTLFKPMGSVKIFGPRKKEIEFLEILPQNILAFSQRQLFLKGQGDAPAKEISWQPRGLKIGRYQAQANLVLSGSENKLTAQTVFFLFPWKASLGLIIALILLFTIKKLLKDHP